MRPVETHAVVPVEKILVAILFVELHAQACRITVTENKVYLSLIFPLQAYGNPLGERNADRSFLFRLKQFCLKVR